MPNKRTIKGFALLDSSHKIMENVSEWNQLEIYSTWGAAAKQVNHSHIKIEIIPVTITLHLPTPKKKRK